MPVALKGAVILRQDGTSFDWQGKCEKCGQLNFSVSRGDQVSPSNTMVSSFYCSACGNTQHVEIRG
jgi:hypothetical protein